MRIHIAIFLLLYTLQQTAVFAQSIEEGNLEYEKNVDAFEQSRKAVTSYCVKITQLEHVSLLDEEIAQKLPSKLSITKTTIELACSVSNQKTLAIRTVEPILGYRYPSKQVYLFIGENSFNIDKDGVFERCFEPREVIWIPNPLTLGAGTFPETKMYRSLTEVLAGLRSCNDFRWGITVAGPITNFHFPSKSNPRERKPRDRSSHHISFDASRGFMPIEQQIRSGTLSLQGSVKPVLVKDVWLPHTVSYISNDKELLHMELDWVSVNEPLPASLFERKSLEKAFSLKDANELLSK